MCTISAVSIEEIRVSAAIGNRQIHEPVIVVITPRCTNSRAGIIHPGTLRHSGKRMVAVVAIEEVLRGRAEVGDKQIQVAIIVVIGPHAAHGVTTAPHDRSSGDFRKSAIASVSKKCARFTPSIGNKEVNPTVPVKIRPTATIGMLGLGGDFTGSDFREMRLAEQSRRRG